MLDTVDFRLTRDEVTGCGFLDEVTPHLNPDTIGVHSYTNGDVVTAKLGNLSVTVTPRQVKVKNGSLCKWMLGDNYQTLTRTDIKRAVEALSDTLHLPFDKADITRLDFGCCIPVKEPTANYFNHLGVLNCSKRLPQADGLYYSMYQGAQQLCFYDKCRESRSKGESIPDLYKEADILRYEMRLLKGVPKLLGVAEVKGATLYDEGFYISLCNRWRNAYMQIRKINEVSLNFDYMTGVKELQKMGVLSLVERVGGELAMIDQINEAQKRGQLHRRKAYELRKAVKEACAIQEGLTTSTTAIPELDKKITEAVRYYR